MELTLAIVISIISVVIAVVNFALSRKDKAVKDTREDHRELIEYQVKELKEDLKNIASDVKDVKKMLDSYKETFRSLIKDSMEEHIKLYHTKEK